MIFCSSTTRDVQCQWGAPPDLDLDRHQSRSRLVPISDLDQQSRSRSAPMSCVVAHFTDIQTARQVDRQVNLFLNLLLEAALVLIKFNTRWHNSIKPP